MKTNFYCSPSSKCWWWHEGTSQGITEAPGNMVRELWLHKNRCFYSTWKELPSRWSQRRWHPSHNVFRIHPLSTMNVFMGCQSNSSNGCWGISVWKQKRWRTHQPTVCDYHSWLPVRQIMLNPEFCASFFLVYLFWSLQILSKWIIYMHSSPVAGWNMLGVQRRWKHFQTEKQNNLISITWNIAPCVLAWGETASGRDRLTRRRRNGDEV